MTYMAMPQHKNPVLGVMKFKILIDAALVIINMH